MEFVWGYLFCCPRVVSGTCFLFLIFLYSLPDVNTIFINCIFFVGAVILTNFLTISTTLQWNGISVSLPPYNETVYLFLYHPTMKRYICFFTTLQWNGISVSLPPYNETVYLFLYHPTMKRYICFFTTLTMKRYICFFTTLQWNGISVSLPPLQWNGISVSLPPYNETVYLFLYHPTMKRYICFFTTLQWNGISVSLPPYNETVYLFLSFVIKGWLNLYTTWLNHFYRTRRRMNNKFLNLKPVSSPVILLEFSLIEKLSFRIHSTLISWHDYFFAIRNTNKIFGRLKKISAKTSAEMFSMYIWKIDNFNKVRPFSALFPGFTVHF